MVAQKPALNISSGENATRYNQGRFRKIIMSDVEILIARVPSEAAGQRFDQVLANLFPDYSRSLLSRWIKSGQALLDGREVRPSHSVSGHEQVELRAEAQRQGRDLPQAIELNLLYQDEDVLVIDKPAGRVVHPGAGNRDGTLVNALLHFDPELDRLPRAGIVHRLDKDTSGVMMVARSLRAHTRLVEQLSERTVSRQYLAVVRGTLVAGGTVDAPIDRHRGDRLKMAVVGGGREAVTHYRVAERYRAHTALECKLETGRTHQIRVHMAYLRHPLVGDPVYGGSLQLPAGASEELIEALRGFRRQALHAQRLSFVHPGSNEEMSFEAAVPEDLLDLMAVLRRDTAQMG